MKKSIFKGIMYALTTVTALSLSSCLSSDDETIVIESPEPDPVPFNDDLADANPSITDPTTNIPNIQATVDEIDGIPVIRIDMTGVKNTDGAEWLKLYGTDSSNGNIWVEVDDKPKYIRVYNNADQTGGNTVKTDIVFTVDNSGSMDEEANAIANSIVSWAQQLAGSGIDARFGVVGYDGRITGAINLTDANTLEGYLNYGSGTSRTIHFGGPDAATLTSKASNYYLNNNIDECGVAAIHYANDLFSFRSGANRVYINFTDEPNYPCGNSKYSVKFFEDQNNWPATKGTIHTVYSSTKSEYRNWNYKESPWLISDYTGGTTIFTSSSFTGVTLSSLPVTGAMQNSYIIYFGNISDLLDGQPHKVHITILSKDGKVKADKVFYVIFTAA